MRTALKLAALVATGVAALGARPLLAQTPMQPAAGTTSQAEPASGRFSVRTTPVSVIIANPQAKAALEAVAPDITGYYPLIGKRTLTQVAALSGGRLDDAMLAKIQAAFDKLPG